MAHTTQQDTFVLVAVCPSSMTSSYQSGSFLVCPFSSIPWIQQHTHRLHFCCTSRVTIGPSAATKSSAPQRPLRIPSISNGRVLSSPRIGGRNAVAERLQDLCRGAVLANHGGHDTEAFRILWRGAIGRIGTGSTYGRCVWIISIKHYL
jgi:hypothetical protein